MGKVTFEFDENKEYPVTIKVYKICKMKDNVVLLT